MTFLKKYEKNDLRFYSTSILGRYLTDMFLGENVRKEKEQCSGFDEFTGDLWQGERPMEA